MWSVINSKTISFSSYSHNNRDLLSKEAKLERRDSATIPLVKDGDDEDSKSVDTSHDEERHRNHGNRSSKHLPASSPSLSEVAGSSSARMIDGKEAYFKVRALLVLKQLPKSRAQTRKEIKRKWKVRLVVRGSKISPGICGVASFHTVVVQSIVFFLKLTDYLT